MGITQEHCDKLRIGRSAKKRIRGFSRFFAVLLVIAGASGNTLAAGMDTAASPSRLVVGSVNPPTGQFFTDMWGNASGDLDVRFLLQGYDLIRWDSAEGVFTRNETAVSGMAVTRNGAGDVTYRISLCHDLYYSDGTRITVRDYAFAVLLNLSPQVKEIGGDTGKMAYILGADAYMQGSTAALAGLRLYGEDEFSVTIDHSYLPFFYELGLLDIAPAPLHIIAPGCDILDGGQGAYIAQDTTSLSQQASDGSQKTAVTDEDAQGGSSFGFSAALLEKTLLDPESGYCSHPSVSSGPYVLDSFEDGEAVFSRNPYFKGDHAGNLPSIEQIVFTGADNATMIEDLAAGKYDLLNKVSAADAAAAGMSLAASGGFAMSSYPRSGMSFISFCVTDADSPAASEKVRSAIAWCLDKQAICEGYEGNLGVAVDGWYGIGQWMYRQAAADLAAGGVLSYDTGDRQEDLDRAAELLNAAGWMLPEMNAGDDPNNENDAGHARTLTLAYPQGNAVGELLQEALVEPLAQIGAALELKALPFTQILRCYYGQEDVGADMLYLASNFNLVFDPSRQFEDAATPVWGHTGIADQELYDLAVRMRMTDPGDTKGYCENWVAFQKRFSEVLPVIPVYSNVYFDFYTDRLTDYEPASDSSWAVSVVRASLEDAADTGDDEDFVFID